MSFNMANLLPQDHKQGILSEYQLRLASAGLGLLLVVLIAGVALLAPSFILTEARHQQYESQLNSMSEANTATSVEAAKQAIRQTNKRLELINAKGQNQLQPTQVLQLLAETQSNGVRINNISIDTKSATDANKKAKNISISGVADTRDNLLSFEENLKNRAQVTSVDLPIDTLASREDTQFDMTVTLQSL